MASELRLLHPGESTRSFKGSHCGATNQQRIQNALEYVTFAIPDTTGVVKENRFMIDFWFHRF